MTTSFYLRDAVTDLVLTQNGSDPDVRGGTYVVPDASGRAREAVGRWGVVEQTTSARRDVDGHRRAKAVQSLQAVGDEG